MNRKATALALINEFVAEETAPKSRKPKWTGFKVDDLVRVKQSQGGAGPTLYMIEWIGERCQCVIREAGNPLAGGQEFDLSCLVKVER